jgi:protein phosphatase
MEITVPELALVLLIGPSGSGKSTFARRHFLPTEVVSSDQCRAMISDDENDQTVTKEAYELLNMVVRQRLALGRLTVIDATNVQPEARKTLIDIAREFHVLTIGIVFNLPEQVCQARNRERPDRNFGAHVVRNQLLSLKRSYRNLQREGIRHVFTLESSEQVDSVSVVRQRLWNNRKDLHGPFDIIGDVHGCYDELYELLTTLGYRENGTTWYHPEDRMAVFVGDLVDRGPKSPAVLRLVMAMVVGGSGLAVPGNHDIKLVRKLNGRQVQVAHGLAETLAQLEAEPPEFHQEIAQFLEGLVSHYVLDDGKLVVAHAGMPANMQGRSSGRVREFALYGQTTGEIDEYGLPVRYPWAEDYRGKAMVVYGHTPVPNAQWLNNTIDIDTGCVFGGKLTAVRYPERELVSVPARQVYAEPKRPLISEVEQLSAQQQQDDLLDIDDVLGKRFIDTWLGKQVIVKEEFAISALEVMSRFAVNPKWLVYLPPTMSPTETSEESGLLEHPHQAFSHYAKIGVPEVICEEKHMGSRAVVVVCRDEQAAQRRFGVLDEGIGTIYTRTGRPFFSDRELEQQLLRQVRDAATRANLWDELESDWLLLDCELMPWSAKAQDLLRIQYAPVGAAARAAMPASLAALQAATERGIDVSALQTHYGNRAAQLEAYTQAYRRYCWPVQQLSDLRLAPFHLLASEGKVHHDKTHDWHLSMIGRLVEADQGDHAVLFRTATQRVQLDDPQSVAAGVAWWEQLTKAGGEGMVVKPLNFLVRNQHSFDQPAIKCRGAEYLRIIYGPEYDTPEHLQRLRKRGTSAKRALALREFALGLEGLERFIQRAPLRSVHECVFGVLALESEPIDPRL